MPNKDDLRSPQLQKLAEKFRKDPDGNLFFPLAEEYAKIGLVDEAIALLKTGIAAHPHLLSARVALGKALLSKGLDAEARAEFEQVVTANPENIMAQKKLAAIYVKAGDKARAIEACQAVLAINPTDAEVLKTQQAADALQAPEVAMVEEPNEPTLVDPTLVDRVTADQMADEPTATVVDPTIRMLRPESSPTGPSIETMAESDPPVQDEVEEELATVSMADLFVAQGHYQRGVDMYRRVLERNPGDSEAATKLENALTLHRLLTPQRGAGPDVKADVLSHVLG
ncbi:MAG: tetratricopeptide repeat protein, partial [Nitrospiria bacterium]